MTNQFVAKSSLDPGHMTPICKLRVASDEATTRFSEPVRLGLPLPNGAFKGTQGLLIRTSAGEELVVQHRVLDCWPDGSAKWILLDWLASTEPGTSKTFELLTCDAPSATPAARAAASVTVKDRDGKVGIDTGAVVVTVTRGQSFPFVSAFVGTRACLDDERTRFIIEDGKGNVYKPIFESVQIEDSGPIRATILQEARMVDSRGSVLCRISCRTSFFAGSATAGFEMTILNPRRARHPGGCWDLGDDNSILIKDAAIIFGIPSGAPRLGVRISPERGAPYEDCTEPVELYQDSSGGENWQSHNHLNRDRKVSTTFRGYRLIAGDRKRDGLRATPALDVSSGQHVLGMAMPYFWQNFPKAIEVSDKCVALRLFPRQSADLHEIQGGEQKTHVFYVAFGRDTVSEEPLEWCRSPLVAHASPEWYSRTRAVPYLVPRQEDPNTAYLSLVDSAIEGADTFERKREVIDEYGWRNFGDIYADHEALYAQGPKPTVSHYNNQYDAILGFGLQFMRSGNIRWLELMHELACHVMDIDIYHCGTDKSSYNHGMFWHTSHYVPADTASHRSYPARYTSGGGPNAGHLYTSGLMLHYFMTGDERSRQAVIDMGRHVVDADNGRKTIFRWLDAGYTGVVSDSDSGYHGPGRAPANSINALLDAHRLTREAIFINKAEHLIRRCIHPNDDLTACNLLNAERRWFYTVFLQTIGKYLDYKIELGQLDEMYAYGRAALLHYATWMTTHEYPYLDKPEFLEYPTETWAAQDTRKSDIFSFAAKHSSGNAKEVFRERSHFFFEHSIGTLSKMPTRTLARPVVLLLSNGLMYVYLRDHPDVSAPEPPLGIDFGQPCVFEPQKARAIRRFKYVLASGLLAALAALTLWATR